MLLRRPYYENQRKTIPPVSSGSPAAYVIGVQFFGLCDQVSVWSRLHGAFYPELGILLLSPISNGANWFYSTGFRTPRYASIPGFHLVPTCLIHLNHKTMHTVLILKGTPPWYWLEIHFSHTGSVCLGTLVLVTR